MNDLHKNLLYVKDLVTAMGKLNEEEQKLLSEKRAVLQPQKIVMNKSGQKKGAFIGILLLVFTLLFLFTTAPYVMNRYRSEKTQLELDKANDEFAWTMNHSNGESYPGYQGETEVNWLSVLLPAFIRGFIIASIITGIAAAVITISGKRNDAAMDKANKRLQMNYEAAIKENNNIVQKNTEIDDRLKQIANKRTLISQEYMQNIIEWYPKDYGYPSAVNFFINLVENHLATTIQECVEQYNTHLFRQEVTDNQQEMLDNQKVMISKQEEMVKLQMIGNMIAAANLMTNIVMAGNTANIANNTADIAKNTKNIERNTAQTAQNTASIKRNTAQTAQNTASINRKLR